MHTAPYEDPGKWTAAVLAVVMHALLIAALLFSVRWQTRHEVVTAELWTPQQMPQAVEPEPPPAETPPEPPVVEAPPPPAPPKAAAPEPVPSPEIKLKADKKPKEKEKAPEPTKPKTAAFSDLLAREESQLDHRKAEIERQRSIETEAALFKQARDEQARIQRSVARQKAEADYIARLQGKIRGNLVQPPNLKGNPVAQFVVTQLPSGEVLDVKLRRASGDARYDDAIERAIRKSSPLPLPNDGSVFSRDLALTFCPDEERGCAR